MAEENDEFAEINKKVKDQVSELYSLIFVKNQTYIKMMLDGIKRSLFICEEGHLCYLSSKESGGKPDFAYVCREMIESLKLFKLFYDKGIKQSKTWKKFPLMEKKETENAQNKLTAIDGSIFDKIEFADENVKTACQKLVETTNTLVELLNKEFSLNKMSAPTFTLEKFMALYNKLGQTLVTTEKTYNSTAKLLSDPNDGNTIKNYEDIKGDIEGVKWIDIVSDSGEASEGDGEEAPKEVQQAVDAVAKEVITVNDKPEDPNIAEKFKKVESDLAKAKEIVTKWADPKNNKSMSNKLNKLIGIVGKDVANQIIPQAWIFNAMNHIKDLLGEAIAQKEMLAFLNENDEEPAAGGEQQGQGQQGAAGGEETPKEDENEKNEKIEKVKTLVNAVDDILKKQKPGEFKDAYNKWLKEVQEILKAAAENEKLKEKMQQLLGGDNADPYKQICLLYLALTSKDEEKEEKPNGKGGDESGEQAGENAEGGGEQAKPGQVQNAAFAWHFTNYIKEALTK